MKYWLMKSEPDTYSIDDLKEAKKDCWDGVRNYQARNFMRDEMKIGDQILFYHSNTKPPGVAGIAKVCKEAYPDYTARDAKSKYFDPKATDEKPIWMMVDIAYVAKFKTYIPLEALKQTEGLEDMLLLRKGNRLSITPVTKEQFDLISQLGLK